MEFKDEIISILKKAGIKEENMAIEVPPNPELGDFAFPCFSLAKEMKKAPAIIAKDLSEKIKPFGNIESVKVTGPYLNFFMKKGNIAKTVLEKISKEKAAYGKKPKGKNIVLVETPGPNTNKPLHLGHLRNILLGMSIINIQRAIGKEVHVVNVVNDRGVHICKSMIAYQMFGEKINDTPEKAKRKSDHFVGDYYVKFNQALKDDPTLDQKAQDMILAWEQGDKEVLALWKKMNKWALDGFKETYDKLGLKIEKEYLESDTYKLGKEIILQGLKDGIFEKEEDGAVSLDLEDKGLGKKILLRANGTTVYMTQDLYLAKKRYEDYKFNEMIYVVGNEQDYHFKVLFEVFKRLKFKFADRCFHFSYGMVELPEGKMKSREGNVIDTDDLIDSVKDLSKLELEERYDLTGKELDARSNAIAMAAIRFFFLKFDPVKNFVFNIKESLSFEGESGPYVQYTHARISSILRKYGKKVDKDINFNLLKEKEELALVKLLSDYPGVVEESGEKIKPHLLCRYLLDLCQSFNEFYHKCPVLQAEDNDLIKARLLLVDSIGLVIASGLSLLDIEALEEM